MLTCSCHGQNHAKFELEGSREDTWKTKKAPESRYFEGYV